MSVHHQRRSPADTDEVWSTLSTKLALSVIVVILRRAQRGEASPCLLHEAERLALRLAERA